jgi:hypothetical protein
MFGKDSAVVKEGRVKKKKKKKLKEKKKNKSKINSNILILKNLYRKKIFIL